MVEVTLLCQCYVCYHWHIGCFQYPVSSGGVLLVILLCVYLSVAEKHLKKRANFKRSLCAYHLFKSSHSACIILLNSVLCNGNPAFLS